MTWKLEGNELQQYLVSKNVPSTNSIFDDLNDRSVVVDEYFTELDVPTYVYPSWLLPRLTARGDLSSSESIK